MDTQTPTVDIRECSEIQIGPRLHYHDAITINQTFVHNGNEFIPLGDMNQFAIAAPELEVQSFHKENVKVDVTVQQINNNEIQSTTCFVSSVCLKRTFRSVVILGAILIVINVIIVIVFLGENKRMAERAIKQEGTLSNLSIKHENEDINNETKENAEYYCKSNLHSAACGGKYSKVKCLLERGVPVNLGNEYGTTALHKAVHCNRMNIAKLLLQRGANVNANRNDNEKPLHTAARYGRENMIFFLTENGAELNAVTIRQKWTPLHFAANANHLAAAKYLVSFGANIELRDVNGKTPQELAMEAGKLDVAEWLAGVNITALSEQINTTSESQEEQQYR